MLAPAQASRAGHPLLRTTVQFFTVLLELSQVVEGVGTTKLAGVNQAHEQIAYVCTVLGLVEKGVLAMKDGLLQGTFAKVVVQRPSPLGAGTA